MTFVRRAYRLARREANPRLNHVAPIEGDASDVPEKRLCAAGATAQAGPRSARQTTLPVVGTMPLCSGFVCPRRHWST